MLFTRLITFGLLGAGAAAQGEVSKLEQPKPDEIVKPADIQDSELRGRTGLCGNDSKQRSGRYTVYNNPWGSRGQRGFQCAYVDGYRDQGVSYHVDWSWAYGNGGVKGYPNAKRDHNVGINRINGLPSSVSWSLGCRARLGASVVYDIFLTSGSQKVEFMLWVAAPGGAHPLSYHYSNGLPVPAIRGVKIGKDVYDLYVGTNGDAKVYSWVLSGVLRENGGRWHTSWSGNFKDFFRFMVNDRRLVKDSNNISGRSILVSSSFGIEATQGSICKFTVSHLDITPN